MMEGPLGKRGVGAPIVRLDVPVGGTSRTEKSCRLLCMGGVKEDRILKYFAHLPTRIGDLTLDKTASV